MTTNMRVTVFQFILGAVAGGVLAQGVNDPRCADCILANGAAYRPHEDCTKFVQCQYDRNANIIGIDRDCPFSTYWDVNTLTCQPAESTECPVDFCADKNEGFQYRARTNCRGYWRCDKNRKSIPLCCSENQFYDQDLGCIEDFLNICNDTCFAVYEPPKQEICDRFAVAGNPSKYQEEILGWGWIIRDCPPGSLFVSDSCACLMLAPSNIGKRECSPEIHLPFTKDHTDQSGFQNAVLNENVEVRDGVAIFNGVDSRLIIPRFTNLEHSTTIIIRVKYSSMYRRSSGIARALVVNSDCGNKPSIMLSEDARSLYFGVGTNIKQFSFTYTSQRYDFPRPGQEKYAEFRFENGHLTGSNGNKNVTIDAPGYLRNVKCALQIGHADNMLPFKGKIDELSIYLCNPDKS